MIFLSESETAPPPPLHSLFRRPCDAGPLALPKLLFIPLRLSRPSSTLAHQVLDALFSTHNHTPLLHTIAPAPPIATLRCRPSPLYTALFSCGQPPAGRPVLCYSPIQLTWGFLIVIRLDFSSLFREFSWTIPPSQRSSFTFSSHRGGKTDETSGAVFSLRVWIGAILIFIFLLSYSASGAPLLLAHLGLGRTIISILHLRGSSPQPNFLSM